MRRKLALMLAVLAAILAGCGYMVVEDAPVRVGSPSIQSENIGR